MGSIIRGAGRHHLTERGFAPRAVLHAAAPARNTGVMVSRNPATLPRMAETASNVTSGLPDGTRLTAFAKPTAMPVNVGLISDQPQAQIMLAREMADNDSIAGAVAETLAQIPFGRFSLSGLPDKAHQEPYLRSCNNLRVQSLMPVMLNTYLVDGAFLGSGLFDAQGKAWAAIVLQDMLYANVRPVPYFGATPIINVRMNEDMLRTLHDRDPRLARYHRFMTSDMSNVEQKLQPENTFYIPRRTQAHHVLGKSMFRPIMLLYMLEKALARGTIELAYRRQRPVVLLTVGDENWDATLEEMQYVGQMYQNCDLDPFGAAMVTRPGVQAQEVGGASDFWKWTDNIEALTAAKLKGLGLPDGLLGGDSALDSVSATLTVFINMVRQLRDLLTRGFMYEKLFPYVSVINNHRKDHLKSFEEHGAFAAEIDDARHQHRFLSQASDLDVDMNDYLQPTTTWHNNLRPEGDREYFSMLQEMMQARVPIPLRILAAAGGLDVHDLLNGERDDLEIRGRVAQYQARVDALQGAENPEDSQQDYDQPEQGHVRAVRRRGLANRTYDDFMLPHTDINGHRYVTTARERRRMMEKENHVIAQAMAVQARRENQRRDQVVHHGVMPAVTPF